MYGRLDVWRMSTLCFPFLNVFKGRLTQGIRCLPKKRSPSSASGFDVPSAIAAPSLTHVITLFFYESVSFCTLMPKPNLTTYDIIRRHLAEGHEPTSGDLAELTGKTKRTVRRNIRKIQENEGIEVRGYQDENTGEKRFAFPEEHHLVDRDSDLDLDAEELRALQISAMAAKTMLAPTPFANALDEAVQKLTEHLSGVEAITSFDFDRQDEQWYFDSGRRSAFTRDVFDAILEALRDDRKLKIDYYSASRGARTPGRIVDPHTIAVRDSSWVLLAYCEMREDDRTFALGGIESATPVGYTEHRPFDADDYFKHAFGMMRDEDEHYVTLAVHPDKVASFRRKQYHSEQFVPEEPHDDGWYRVTFKVAGLHGIASFVRSWGPHVRVEDPPELREQIKTEAEAMAALYGEGDA